jgi:predicted alpha-1,6-mannanase (GH76 family)
VVENGQPLEECLRERAGRHRRFLLGQATGDAGYFTKATNAFLWLRATLFEPTTGKVYDNISTNGRIARFSLTYNQGTFVGAANLLGYTNEARLAALYTMNQLCKDGYLPPAERTATVADSMELV